MNPETTPQEPPLTDFLRSPDFSYELRRCAIAFPILILLAFGAATAFPDLRDHLVGFLADQVSQSGVLDSEGSPSALPLMFSNMSACAMTILYGAVPFLQLPALAMGLNAMALGVLAAYYMANGLGLGLYLAALVPHGIFELPALVLAFASGLYLCGQVTRRCKKDTTALPFFQALNQACRVYLVLIPVLAAAALAETYLTPLVLGLLTRQI